MVPRPRRQDRVDPRRLRRPSLRANVQPLNRDRGSGSLQEESAVGEGTEYFTPEFFDFFRGLAKNNRKEWFDANKAQFQAVVLEPSVRFVRDAGGPVEKNQSPHRRGRPRVRWIRLADLPGHSVLAGQEPVQDPYRDPLLAR